jgi:hypothetical protein
MIKPWKAWFSVARLENQIEEVLYKILTLYILVCSFFLRFLPNLQRFKAYQECPAWQVISNLGDWTWPFPFAWPDFVDIIPIDYVPYNVKSN